MPCRVAFAVPDHPWVATEDGAAVRIAMTVVAQDVERGSPNLVTSEEVIAPDKTYPGQTPQRIATR